VGRSDPMHSASIALGLAGQNSPVAVARKSKESNLMLLSRVKASTPTDADELAIGVKKVGGAIDLCSVRMQAWSHSEWWIMDILAKNCGIGLYCSGRRLSPM
jgi:hypothetical protein